MVLVWKRILLLFMLVGVFLQSTWAIEAPCCDMPEANELYTYRYDTGHADASAAAYVSDEDQSCERCCQGARHQTSVLILASAVIEPVRSSSRITIGPVQMLTSIMLSAVPRPPNA